MKDHLAPEILERRIFLIRGRKVMLDADLASLYDVRTKELNKAVGRNRDRFPEDFVFRLTVAEARGLRFQIGTSKGSRGGRRYLPFAFTEQGVAMLSGVLRSRRAVLVNVAIMRTFVRLREWLSHNKELAARLAELEGRVATHDERILSLFRAIRRLMGPTGTAKRGIGFRPPGRED